MLLNTAADHVQILESERLMRRYFWLLTVLVVTSFVSSWNSISSKNIVNLRDLGRSQIFVDGVSLAADPSTVKGLPNVEVAWNSRIDYVRGSNLRLGQHEVPGNIPWNEFCKQYGLEDKRLSFGRLYKTHYISVDASDEMQVQVFLHRGNIIGYVLKPLKST